MAAHLAVAFAPYLSRGQESAAQTRGVWQLGRQLFLRLPLSAVYALVVFGGLALGLAAVVQLFGVKVDSDRYFELWIACTFILQTWHFLAGIPQDFTALERDDSYPRGLRIFAQFVLLPLLGLYLAILYAYVVKILVTGSLPSGWVGCSCRRLAASACSPAPALPSAPGAGGRFVRRVETGFHLAILPLLGLLFVSLAERVGAYGITERRYFLAVLGLWLAAASIYRLKWGRRTLTWIPMSLCLVAALTSFGPWGALSVARESQSGRLVALLRAADRLDGQASGGAPVSQADLREMSRILDYLVETHGKSSLRRWPGPTATGPSESAPEFMGARGLDYVTRYESRSNTLSYYGRNDLPIEVHGYDWLVPYDVYDSGDPQKLPARFTFTLSPNRAGLEVLDRGKLRTTVSLAPCSNGSNESTAGKGQPRAPARFSRVRWPPCAHHRHPFGSRRTLRQLGDREQQRERAHRRVRSLASEARGTE